MNYEIFTGAESTMRDIATRPRGVVALNPKTMKWQTVDKTAQFKVVAPESGRLCWQLWSNLDLHQIAKDKGLIM